jgi:hypothetical protein
MDEVFAQQFDLVTDENVHLASTSPNVSQNIRKISDSDK